MDFLHQLHIEDKNNGTSTGSQWISSKGKILESFSPVDGKLIASVTMTDRESYESVINKAKDAFIEWRKWPAPRRGEVVRQIAEALRANKQPLGKLVSYEMGKSL